jgi:hypothetical protein
MAQGNVYSLNVVGYHQVTIAPGALSLIANQLQTTNNTLASLLPSVPPGTIVYKYSAGWTPYTFDEFDLKWLPDGAASMNPGEGAMVRNVGTTPLTLTFVGEVLQGNLETAVPAGLSVRSSKVPQAGKLTTDLQFPAVAGDVAYKYAGGFTPYTFDEFELKWTPEEPTIAVGEAFMSSKAAAANWTRNFTVPQQ